MERIRRAFALAVMSALIIACLVPALSASAEEPPPVSVVVMILSPYMTWEDVGSEALPTLRALAQESAMGNLNTRSRVEGPTRVSLTGSALMLSSGSWTAEDRGAPGAYSLDEGYETGDVAEAYRRFMGITPDDEAIAYLGFPRAQRANDFDTLNTTLGLLGQSVLGAGGVTAAIGNSDAGFSINAVGRDRPAALVAMDERGLVGMGDVSRRLLEVDEDGPFGLSTDRDRFDSEFLEALEAAGSGGPALIVLDPGDAHRAVEFADLASTEVAEAHRLQALETLDHVVALVWDTLPADGMLMVVTPLPVMDQDGPVPLTPAIVHGPGWEGYLSSSSTHRLGLVTLTDVSATVLSVMGIERPVEMLGSAMEPVLDGASLTKRLSDLTDANGTAVSIDGARVRVLNVYILSTVLLIVVASLFVVRRSYPAWLGSFLRLALLFVLVVPVASYLMFSVVPRPSGEWRSMLLLLGVALVVWGLALLAAWSGRWVRPLSFTVLLTALVLLADPWLGSPLSSTGFFSYSPLTGARYYGMGNEAAGLLFGSLLVGVSLFMDDHAEEAWVRPFARWGLPVVGALTVWTAAAPTLGANVGVAAWGVVCFAVVWSAMNGVRVSWKSLVVIAVVVVLVVIALSVVDLSGDSETHLARALESAERGGLSELRMIVVRKVETNLRVLTHTNWAYVLVAVLGLLGFMRWKPRGDFMETLQRFPYFAHAMTALLAGGLVAYFTEDSGIVIPALMLLYPGVGVLYLMLSRERWGGGADVRRAG